MHLIGSRWHMRAAWTAHLLHCATTSSSQEGMLATAHRAFAHLGSIGAACEQVCALASEKLWDGSGRCLPHSGLALTHLGAVQQDLRQLGQTWTSVIHRTGPTNTARIPNTAATCGQRTAFVQKPSDHGLPVVPRRHPHARTAPFRRSLRYLLPSVTCGFTPHEASSRSFGTRFEAHRSTDSKFDQRQVPNSI